MNNDGKDNRSSLDGLDRKNDLLNKAFVVGMVVLSTVVVGLLAKMAIGAYRHGQIQRNALLPGTVDE